MASPTRNEATPPAFVSRQVTAARRFYHNLKPRPTRGLSIVCGGWEECAPDYMIDRKTFPFLSLEFVASGRGQLQLGSRSHALEPGTVFTYGPGISQLFATSPKEPLGKYFLDFVGDRGRKLLRECRLEPGSVVQLTSLGEVRQAFDTLVRLASGHHRDTARLCELQVEVLLLVIVRSTQPGSPTERRSLATFERCRQYIDTHFLALDTLEQAASACHVDIAYLCRLFRRFLDETPFRYLQRLQMQWAAERLHTSHRLVREVADDLRIDPFQFSRTFKRIHGVSPSAFLSSRG
ncbi:MAG TPA: AraC family transcriptional regulator [Opitutaceae bacterium]|nr:AraC family transcriptional regulator [Opitutaceae bacterium]